MCDLLSALHDPHNCRLCLESPISGHALMGLLVFLLGLLGLDLVDLDAVFGVREAVIDVESISNIDVLAFRQLAEDAIFGTGERLECPFELKII